MKKLQKLIMLWKDPDPCKECLVYVMCRNECKRKDKWNSRTRNFFEPYKILFMVIIFFTAIFAYGCMTGLYMLRLVSYEEKEVFNMFPDWEEIKSLDDDYYY